MLVLTKTTVGARKSPFPVKVLGHDKSLPSRRLRVIIRARLRLGYGGHGGLAQLVEHLPCTQGVNGSNPLSSTKKPDGLVPSGFFYLPLPFPPEFVILYPV